MKESDHTVLIAVIAASGAVAVVLLAGLIAYFAAKRDRRRLVYSDAVKTAVAWKEMLYRVRRREAGQERELISLFHELQDKLQYYEAWVGSESKYMRRSYDRMIAAIKKKTLPLIQGAWAEDVRPVPGNAIEADKHPDINDSVQLFLRDVRSHLSPQPWRKLAMWWRNRDK